MKISACYIVANEADELRKSIQSIENIADEFLIVDTGSNPEIKQIACEYKASYLYYTWHDDFAAARNFALQHISGEWIIFLDADEYLVNSENVRNYLRDILAKAPQADALISLLYNYDKDTAMEQGHSLVIRFFRGDKGLHYEGLLHEVLTAETRELNTIDARDVLQIIHTGYSTVISEKKMQRNLRVLQKDERENGLTPRLMYYYCQTYFGLKDYEKALRYAFLAYRAPVPLLTPNFAIFNWILESMRKLDYPLPTMLKWASAAVKEFPDIPEFYGERMMILSAMGELAMARANALRALDLYKQPQNTLMGDRYAVNSVKGKIENRLAEIEKIFIQQGINPAIMPLELEETKSVTYFSINSCVPNKEQLSLLYHAYEKAGEIWGETGIPGVYLDFNAGLRLEIPKGEWYVRISDAESGIVFFEQEISNQILVSMEKYRISWRVDIANAGVCVFSHSLDFEGQCVFFYLGSALGEAVTVLPYIREFARVHNCRVACNRKQAFESYIKHYYAEIEQYDVLPLDTYAVYYAGFFQELDLLAVENTKAIPIQQAIEHIFGRECMGAKSTLGIPKKKDCETQPYVCIAMQASSICKCWLHPDGWQQVADYLRSKGYRVCCIDGDASMSQDGYTITIPQEVEDCTGRKPLEERIELLSQAAFFIGGPSGVSWLAQRAGCPVILISGITMPFNDFFTPYRVQNYMVCHGCYADLRCDWKHNLCPRHHGTEREYECSRMITPQMVISMIDRVERDNKAGEVK